MLKQEPIKIYYLIKFGKKHHLDKLLNEGEICFNSIEYFQKSKVSGVGDYYEGIFETFNYKVKSISCEHPLGNFTFIPVQDSKSKFAHFNDNPHLVLSTYAITEDSLDTNNNLYKIDFKMSKGYEYALIIKNPEYFINSVVDELSKRKLVNIDLGLVEYKDYSKEQVMGLTFLNKDIEYDYQKEFRIIFESTSNEKEIISIGSIEDYCEIVDSKFLTECIWRKK